MAEGANVTAVEWSLFLAAFALCALAGAGALSGRVPERGLRLLAESGAAVLLVLAVARWVRAAHPPIFGTLEASMSDAFMLSFAGAVWARARPELARVGWAGAGLGAAALLGHGLFFPRAPLPLTISERSLWVDVHALVAFATLALYLLAGACAVALLAGRKEGAEEREAALDHGVDRFVAFGFLGHTALVLLGVWYGRILFGTFWRWDPVETLGALSWLAFGLLIHARLFFAWRGRRYSVATLLALATVALLYWGVPHLGRAITYHSFDLVLEP